MEPFESVRRLRSMFNLARTAGLLVALSVSLAGCSTGVRSMGHTDPTPSPVAETEGYVYIDRAQAPTAKEKERTPAVYVAVLRTFVNDNDGPTPAVEVIKVLTDAEEEAGWVSRPSPPEPIPTGVRETVTAQLDQVVRVEWTKAYRVPEDPKTWFVRLSPVPDNGKRLEISVSARDGYDEGWLTTYVVQPAKTGWKVTGTTGPAGVT